MNTLRLRYLALAAGIAASICGPAAATDLTRLSGVLTDAKTGAPIGATVVIHDGEGRVFTVKSDDRGRFTALGLAPGLVTLDVGNKDYDVLEVSCNLPDGRAGRVALGMSNQRLSMVEHLSTCSLDAETQDKTELRYP